MADEPKTVTLSAEEAANQRAAYDLLNRLYRDPKHNPAIVAAVKELAPDTPLPEPPADVRIKPIEARIDDIVSSVEKITKAQQEEIEARRNAEEDASLSARIAAAAKRFNFNPEGVKRATERLIAQKSGDVEGAFALVAAENPIPRPMPASGFPRLADPFGVRGSDDEGLKRLHTHPDEWQQEEVERYFAENSAA